METACREENPDSSSSGVFEITGEPAVVINGVPPVSLTDGTLFLCETILGTNSERNTSFGDWLVGREVRKHFGEQLYNGKVTAFDKESGWYSVIYEDGDYEDLEWHELQEVLLSLDITVPLKTLASKVIKMRQKRSQKRGRSASRPRDKLSQLAKGVVIRK
ncbi:hypothetical protein LguiA_016171 [Lonicera macranthoides]